MTLRSSPQRFPHRTVTSFAELSEVRSAFASWLASAVGRAQRVEDLSVVVSELGANAVHGTPHGGAPPTVSAWVEDAVLTLEVANQVEDDPEVVQRDLADPLREGGRGLVLVAAFVDDVEVDVGDGEVLRVRCRAQL